MVYGSWNGQHQPVQLLAAEPPMDFIAGQELGTAYAGGQSYFIAISRASLSMATRGRKVMALNETGQGQGHSARRVGSRAWSGAKQRGDQVGIRCVFMRGGTSRGAFLHAADIPQELALREQLLLGIYGSPDIRQIDGLGGAHPLTSKVAIVGHSSRSDADVDFTFGQVCIDKPHVEFSGNCGNMAAAVGPFAIDEGLVAAAEPVTRLRIHLTNTQTLLTAEVPVCNGLARVEGYAEISGVPSTGARILLDFGDVGGTLGKGLLPTGRARDVLQVWSRTFEVSIVDAGNPIVFVRASAFGLKGTELPSAFTPGALAQMQAVRAAAAQRLGLEAEALLAVPKLYLISAPTGYIALGGQQVRAEQVHLLGRGLSMGVPHQAYAATAAVCTAAAALLPETLVQEVLRPDPVQPK
jgi:2-methylaconitate cis-trans-isomerase PrpF